MQPLDFVDLLAQKSLDHEIILSEFVLGLFIGRPNKY
jgi:hypothetical protein